MKRHLFSSFQRASARTHARTHTHTHTSHKHTHTHAPSISSQQYFMSNSSHEKRSEYRSSSVLCGVVVCVCVCVCVCGVRWWCVCVCVCVGGCVEGGGVHLRFSSWRQ